MEGTWFQILKHHYFKESQNAGTSKVSIASIPGRVSRKDFPSHQRNPTYRYHSTNHVPFSTVIHMYSSCGCLIMLRQWGCHSCISEQHWNIIKCAWKLACTEKKCFGEELIPYPSHLMWQSERKKNCNEEIRGIQSSGYSHTTNDQYHFWMEELVYLIPGKKWCLLVLCSNNRCGGYFRIDFRIGIYALQSASPNYFSY